MILSFAVGGIYRDKRFWIVRYSASSLPHLIWNRLCPAAQQLGLQMSGRDNEAIDAQKRPSLDKKL